MNSSNSITRRLALVPWILTGMAATAADPLFDPVIDDAAREWSYAAQSTTVIGLPFVPEPVQVTYDGAVYTRHAELAFFHGSPLKPVMARQKSFRDGWIPVVEYAWREGGIDYQMEVFSGELPALGRANLVQFARLEMTNPGPAPAEGVVAAGMRGTAASYRLGGVKEPITSTTRFTMANQRLTRNGKVVYFYAAGATEQAAPGVAYTAPYLAQDHHVTDRAITGLSVYQRTLAPGETFSADFKLPRVPLTDAAQIAAVAAANHQTMLDQTVAWWNSQFGNFKFEIPEQRVNDSYRAAMVHLMLATRDQGEGPRQGSGLPYDQLFLNDYIDMLLAYSAAGMNGYIEPNVSWLLGKQHSTGMFIDIHNRGNADFVTSHGQGLFALAYHLVMTRDLTYGKQVYAAIKSGAEFIVNDHRTNNEHGLIRSSIPYDAPMLTGYHTCHNLFALLALRTSIRAARIMGETADVTAWTAAEATYRQAILNAIEDVYQREGYIRSGFYDWTAGTVQNNGSTPNSFPNQDWENNLLVFPTELLAPDDPRVAGTLAEIRRRKYREGVMTYRNGMHIHQYVTLNQAQQYRAIGDQHHALLDLYHVLLHNGPTHEGFENLVIPWSTRTPDASSPPPHGWAAAKTALFIRNMMVCEYGGLAGLAESDRDLYLFSLLSPSWIVPGKQVVVSNAPTEMGPVSATLAFTGRGATLGVSGRFHHPPRHLVFRIPDPVVMTSFTSDATTAFEDNGLIHFSPDLTTATIAWSQRPGFPANNYQEIFKGYRSEYPNIVQDDNYDPALAGTPFLDPTEQAQPAEALSFDLVRRAFLKEYGRRFSAYVSGGGTPYAVEPPALLTPQQRQRSYEAQFGDIPVEPGLAVGKPVTASAALASYPATHAVDGNSAALASSWQTDPYPAWLKIDLEEVMTVDRVHLFPYWGGGRYYQYTVEVSKDDVSWQQVVDQSGNTTPADAAGVDHPFTAATARYVRVNLLFHSLNTGVHLVEVRVFGPRKVGAVKEGILH